MGSLTHSTNSTTEFHTTNRAIPRAQAATERPPKPIPIEPQLEQIPAELREREQWIVWRYEPAGAKWTKIPYDPQTDQRAKANDPATWRSFDCAARAYQQLCNGTRSYDGIGYEFAEDDPYCGADFDHCFDEIEDRKILKPDAARWVESFNSYTEYSVSGDGLHVITKAKPSRNFKNDRAGWELYDRTRFFTFTGDSYHDDPLPIAERQEAAEAFISEYSPKKKSESKPRHQSNGHDACAFATWDALRAELGRRIEAHPTARKNSSGKLDCRGVCHDGEGNSGLFYDPVVNQAHCNAGCDQATLLRAFNLPEAPNLTRLHQQNDHAARQAPQSEKNQTQPPEVVAHAIVLNKILEVLQPCDFHALGGFQPQSEIKQKHYIVLCVRQLLTVVKERKFALARKNDFIFVYNGEYWREIDRDTLKDFLGKAAEALGVVSIEAQHYEFKDKLYKQFLAAAHFEQTEPENGKALINLKNGTFEITADSQELRPFNAADFLKYQLPFDYNEEAKAPIFAAYLNRVLPEPELQNIVAEFFGYVFTRNLKLEKALLLYGSGANGKSVMFDVMNALLGAENTANYSLSDLMQEHNRAQIAHKLLNYGSEINASVTKDVFKILVSGEEIMARLKYGNSFLMKDYAKLCFNCNELPKDIEHNEAYFRRLLITPFRIVIPTDDQDPELAQKIIDAELSGVFNWVLEGLRRLLKNKRFTASKIAEEALSDYKRESDSVACYLDEANQNPNGLLKDIYPDYKNYCSESGIKPLGKQKFRKRLEAHGFEVERVEAGMRISRKE